MNMPNNNASEVTQDNAGLPGEFAAAAPAGTQLPEAPSVAPPVAAKNRPSGGAGSGIGGKTILGVLIVAAVLLVAAAAYRFIGVGGGQPQPVVVLLDVVLVQEAKKQELAELYPTYEELMREVDKFATELQTMLQAYRDAGLVVLNKNVVISAPEHLDVTQIVADRLGVDLSILRRQ